MKKQAALSALCVLAAVLSFFVLPAFLGLNAPEGSSYIATLQAQLDARLATAAAFFASTKIIAGLLTLLASFEVELSALFAGATINPMVLFTPLAASINKLSDLFLLAMGAIVLQKVLLVAGGWLGLKIIMPLAFVAGALSVWMKQNAAERLKKAAFIFGAVGIVTCGTIPLSIELAGGLETYFMADMITQAEASIQESTESLSEVQSAFESQERSLWEKAKDNLNYQQMIKKAQESLGTVTESVKTAAKNLVNILIVISITTIILPVGTMLALWMVLRALLKQG